MKKFCLLLILLIGAGLSVNAESTVCIFIDEITNNKVRLCIDGEEVCDMSGTVDNIDKIDLKLLGELDERLIALMASAGLTKEEENLIICKIAPCFRTIKVKKEGNVTFTIVCENPNDPENTKPYECDKSLNLKDGETYNLHFVRSQKDVFRIPKDKDVEKWTKEWEELPTVTYPKEK